MLKLSKKHRDRQTTMLHMRQASITFDTSCYIAVMRVLYNDNFLMQNNNCYPLREWHFEHMKKTVLKFVTGIPDDATSWQKKQHKKYNKISNIRRGISYDIKHGVTNEEVLSFMDEVRDGASFSDLRRVDGSEGRLNEIKLLFMPLRRHPHWGS
jgi:hypothetical protein